MSDEKQKVFIGCPTYDGNLHYKAAYGILVYPTSKYRAIYLIGQGSLLAANCNTLWAAALNVQKEHGIKWFAMLHSDIAPEQNWVDKLIEIAERENADLLSALVPIKDQSGITSTAIEIQGATHFPWMRLSQHQIHHPSFPKTFDCAQAIKALAELPENLRVVEPSKKNPETAQVELLVNTGCMIVRLDQPWSPRIKFTITDELLANSEGKYYHKVLPEDWMLSKMVRSWGGRVMATSEIKVDHIGSAFYNSENLWGPPIDSHCPESKKTA